ncbi:hypothetical protein [Spirillospora sp. CA-294931]|uniref:hypothetical protein n=1 Tax=Spirillospora sp. CA-294931 TaxID=3240042 RepID=UPI003D92A073
MNGLTRAGSPVQDMYAALAIVAGESVDQRGLAAGMCPFDGDDRAVAYRHGSSQERLEGGRFQPANAVTGESVVQDVQMTCGAGGDVGGG